MGRLDLIDPVRDEDLDFISVPPGRFEVDEVLEEIEEYCGVSFDHTPEEAHDDGLFRPLHDTWAEARGER